eukprot:jgi/Pico_ML_1/55550/g1220.t1
MDVHGTEELEHFPSGWDPSHGRVLLYVMGVAYMFLALAMVCDEYFVPALEVLAHKLGVEEDVAGATFMAAGGSAPELATGLLGVFVSRSNVGVGTIVGSAAFNVLFVTGACAFYAKEALRLHWYPLLRDSSFYALDLLVLALFFASGAIQWWHCCVLLLLYTFYVLVVFMDRSLRPLAERSKHLFALSFLGSIFWICIFAYFMVWWTTVIGLYMGISTTVLGITMVAAGSSVPDLITSLIVARKGYGDMAISSSIGSNIFDVTIGLPLPWLLHSLMHKGKPISVNDMGLGIQVIVLLVMVFFTILTVSMCKWRLSHRMGLAMLGMYVIYLASALFFELVWAPV